MDQNAIYRDLREFIVRECLEGEGSGLDADTPLLEWGVLNSITMHMLNNHIAERFSVEVPFDKRTPQNFATLRQITTLVESLQK
ncbi:MAG: acyl carrier protein [Deltaproteobacteria bacterium]|nr:acyl carrier protein [Deltaproteobacteria bacterium]